MKLVIVESPAKCKTIKKYLGDDYIVKASLGHVRELAMNGKGGLGVDVDNGFVPTYKISKDKINVVKDLIETAKKCDEVILATDPDREGEAIAWHLTQILNIDPTTTKRLEFHEITRDSITSAISSPRVINKDLVSSQEARRILDRIIGFKLSTLINKKIHSKSAGRVQTTTLKLIADHDKDIESFVPEEYFTINVKVKKDNKEYDLIFSGVDGSSSEIKDRKVAEEIISRLQNVDVLEVKEINKNIKSKEAKEPFTTSTMQQEAFAKLKFKTDKTQKIAQQLYEGIEVNGEHVGLITYMRTDSIRLSPSFLERANNFIIENYGKEYLGKPKHLLKKGNVQDAHEAIRPTSNHRTPESIKQYLTSEQYALYKLIYNRCLASLMKAKKEEITSLKFEKNGVKFHLDFSKTIFPGYEVVLKEDKNKSFENVNFAINDSFEIIEKGFEEKTTQPPAHYSEAKIVKMMEDAGIGRPSTYASTIQILRKRKYVSDERGILISSEQGQKTSFILEENFPDIVNVKYTAEMEKKLDEIAAGKLTSYELLNSFYYPFIEEVEKANNNIQNSSPDYTGENCPICGSPLVYKDGKNGKFIGCSNYPKCHYVQKKEKEPALETGENCPLCGKPLVYRKNKKGETFIACSGFPTCRYIKSETKESIKKEFDESDYIKPCPKCGNGHLVKKKGKYGYFLGCTNYPTCNYMERIFKKKSAKAKQKF